MSFKINGQIEPGAMAFFLFLAVLGVFATIASLHVLNGLAYAGAACPPAAGHAQYRPATGRSQSHRRQERAKAERSEQSRRELIVNVSHELRTPIASIRGHVESLLMANEEQPTNRQPRRASRATWKLCSAKPNA